MAHNINITNGVASFVSLRQSAWHGLGKVVQTEMSDADIARFAGIDWKVTEQPIYAGTTVDVGGDSMTTYDTIPGHKLLRRGDTNANIAVVGSEYRTFQNDELVALMRAIGGDGLIWETAGCLGTVGDTVWGLARIPDLSFALGDDKNEMYMLISNGHGNARALTIMPTLVRVVCQNTMRAADGSKAKQKARIDNADKRDFSVPALSSGYAIMHTANLDDAVKDVRRAYQSCVANRDATKVAFDMLAAKACDDAAARQYWNTVFGETAAADETPRMVAMREEREAKRRAALADIWVSPTSQTDAARKTMFGAYQAAVEYLDHVAPARSATGRAYRAVMGSDVATKRLAWNVACEYAAA
jgi:phage/plasmid-like protein (TIGR03299 family)